MVMTTTSLGWPLYADPAAVPAGPMRQSRAHDTRTSIALGGDGIARVVYTGGRNPPKKARAGPARQPPGWRRYDAGPSDLLRKQHLGMQGLRPNIFGSGRLGILIRLQNRQRFHAVSATTIDRS